MATRRFVLTMEEVQDLIFLTSQHKDSYTCNDKEYEAQMNATIAKAKAMQAARQNSGITVNFHQ